MYSKAPSSPPRERKYIAHLKIVAAKKEAAYPMSCAIDSDTRSKLNIIARSLGVRVADLLATAIDLTYGDDLSETPLFTELLNTPINPHTDEISSENLEPA